ncbi:MAG TPA: beta-ketoacyl synthase N-terminal-like domain-containing protein, partial [Gammaproteobacteria bacterium]|nr:beta-ketoacyl synthase N-terminal-like domain-containing protein [Gammaproteobacteria bacterium]
MNSYEEAYIVGAIRTPVTKAITGSFSQTRPDDLLAAVFKELLKKIPSLDPVQIEDIIIGCAMPEGAQGMNVARIAALMGGIPDSVPAMTINRFCASGLQAIALAREKIVLGEADVIIAGGVESMSLIPMGGYHYRANPKWFEHDGPTSIAFTMGITAEIVGKKWNISREKQDEFSLRSHQLAIDAQDNNYFDQEIVPITIQRESVDLHTREVIRKSIIIRSDEGPRNDYN